MTDRKWIAVDWGTTNLRAWQIGAGGEVIDRLRGGRGMNALKAAEFEPELLQLAGSWLVDSAPVPVLICGMAGARQGWREAPYMELPAPIGDLAGHTIPVPTAERRLIPRIVPGLCQTSASDPDVMRGEETQLAGLQAANPAFRGLVCLPGTHSKWVRMQDGKILGFTSFMTGEIFQLLRDRSILRHSVGETGNPDSDGFQAGIDEARSAKGCVQARLFKIRAGDLLHGRSGDWNRSYLSGLLIGAEIVEATAGADAGRIPVIGAPAISTLYRDALEHLGFTTEYRAAEAATLSGLTSIYQELEARDAWSQAAQLQSPEKSD